jgi:hypothetical protein
MGSVDGFDDDEGPDSIQEEIDGNTVRAALRQHGEPPEESYVESDEYKRVRESLEIDAENITQEFVRAPAILARFVERYVVAEEAHLRAKFKFEQTEARLLLTWRERLVRRAHMTHKKERVAEEVRHLAAKKKDSKDKRHDVKLRLPTVTEIDAAVKTDPEYEASREAYIAAECGAKREKGFWDAARVKRDMLTNIGMKQNAELRVAPIDVANGRTSMRGNGPRSFGNGRHGTE